VTVGPSIREMAAEEARRRAMNDEPHPGDDRWKEEDHPSVLTDTSPDSMSELKELSKEERQELGRLACEQLGVEFEAAEDKG
jgi:hypothetical protein